MRVLGLDFGDRWWGIALSDATGLFAYPMTVAEGLEEALNLIQEAIRRDQASLVVVGLPRNMDGSLGTKAQEVLRFVGVLRERIPVPVETWDERLTTVEAEGYLREAGVPRRRWKEKVNQMAAQILLQSWLDARRSRQAEEGGGDPEGPVPTGEADGPPS